jgi:DNA invertase Pin-like site-specific DNA recombinase
VAAKVGAWAGISLESAISALVTGEITIMDATAYLRVSSRAQDFATQKSAIERAATARGDTIIDWRAEKRSGKTLARPELDRLRADARAGHVRRLYVFKLDRLTRSGIRDTFEVIEELRAHGAELVSVSDGFALDGPAAEVVLAVMAWAAKMERLAINERISAARERVEAEGRSWGRPSRFTRADRRRMEEMRDAGKTIREIAISMKVPRSSVAYTLSRKDGADPRG